MTEITRSLIQKLSVRLAHTPPQVLRDVIDIVRQHEADRYNLGIKQVQTIPIADHIAEVSKMVPLNELRLNVAHFLSQFQPETYGNYSQAMSVVPNKRIKAFADYIAAMGDSATRKDEDCKGRVTESPQACPKSPTICKSEVCDSNRSCDCFPNGIPSGYSEDNHALVAYGEGIDAVDYSENSGITSSYLGPIPDEKACEYSVEKLYVVGHKDANLTDAAWTLSFNPGETGWETDSGFDGYGLKKNLAEAIAQAWNERSGVCSEMPDNRCPDCGATMIEVCSGLEINARGDAAGLCRHSDYCEKPLKPVAVSLEKCARAHAASLPLAKGDFGWRSSITQTKAVLDAAGVRYVE